MCYSLGTRITTATSLKQSTVCVGLCRFLFFPLTVHSRV
uniref:Uncharacterized protein n=1 Tax=Anguilla anguilla TaxID=7936 RepID=A0A0E9WP95_ANGAN